MLPKSSKVIIELYGLPGAGKSTLARTLAAEHRFLMIPSSSVSRFDYLVLSIQYPLVVLFWLTLILKNFLVTKSFKQFRYNVSLLFMSLKKIRAAYQSPRSQIVVDEGLLQRLLSYSDIILSEQEIARLLAISPHGNLIVLVNDREVLQDRFTSSAHARASEGEDLLQRWRQNMVQNITKISSVGVRTKGVIHATTKESTLSDIMLKIKDNKSL